MAKDVLDVTELTFSGLNYLFNLKKLRSYRVDEVKLGRDSEGGGGSGSVIESDCVGQVNTAIIVDEAGNGLKGDSVIVDVDGDTLRGITVGALTSTME